MSAMGNTESENALIQSSILTVASSSGVDARAILATVMQESTGKVRVGTTNNGVSNSGLMQSHAGISFDPADPAGSILQMITDGTEGTAHGDGLMQTLAAQNGNYYEAFRKYNSGSVNTADLNDGFGSSPLYVQQMANRLMGVLWVSLGRRDWTGNDGVLLGPFKEIRCSRLLLDSALNIRHLIVGQCIVSKEASGWRLRKRELAITAIFWKSHCRAIEHVYKHFRIQII
jgi:hypothetical protein